MGGTGVGRCTVLSQWCQLLLDQYKWVDWAPCRGGGRDV